MFNAEKPSLEELPSSAQLIRSTVIAAVGAVVILVTVVLPAEYGVDPTGVGRALGLAEMGEIKQELQREAEEDAQQHSAITAPSLADILSELFVSKAHAEEVWRDTVVFTLAPGASAEIKMVMAEGDVADYVWTAEGGRINFDLHAHGGGQSVTYDKGRGKTEGDGSISAPFPGEHGWFWRNRDKQDVTITLQVRGSYSEIKETY
ncbi:MAG: transmembrane anchor protein [Pseudomonadota bacterium]